MARLTEAATPDELQADTAAAPASAASTPAEALVREVHALLTTQFFAPHSVNRLSLVHNPGVGAKAKNSAKRLRSECLQDAAKQWPHLIRQEPETTGGKVKFQRRMCDTGLMEKVFAELTDTPLQEFGDWTAWTWPREPTGESVWDDFYEGRSCHVLLPSRHRCKLMDSRFLHSIIFHLSLLPRQATSRKVSRTRSQGGRCCATSMCRTSKSMCSWAAMRGRNKLSSSCNSRRLMGELWTSKLLPSSRHPLHKSLILSADTFLAG